MSQEHSTTESGHEERVQPRVSVVVPVFNHSRFVEATLRSIFSQTLLPAELIVIDDGSSDDSPRIVERVLTDSPVPANFIARANRGLCATLNEGLSLSSCEYFAYLGSDDLWLPGFLEARVALLISRPRAVLAYGHAYLVDANQQVVDCTQDWASYADGDARQMLLLTVAPMSPTVLYRREALTRHGWNEEARLEDYEVYLHLSAEGEFAFDPRVLSSWRRHEENASWNQQMMLEEHLKAQRRVLPGQGIKAAEIERLQKQIKFSRAKDFVRVGDKRGALRLALNNLSGISSVRDITGFAWRFLVPKRLLRRRAKRRALKYRDIKLGHPNHVA